MVTIHFMCLKTVSTVTVSSNFEWTCFLRKLFRMLINNWFRIEVLRIHVLKFWFLCMKIIIWPFYNTKHECVCHTLLWRNVSIELHIFYSFINWTFCLKILVDNIEMAVAIWWMGERKNVKIFVQLVCNFLSSFNSI